MPFRYKFMTIKPDGGGGHPTDPYPWISTGLTIGANERLTVIANGLIHLYSPNNEASWKWVDPDGCKDNVLDCGLPKENPDLQQHLCIPYAPGAKLIGLFTPTNETTSGFMPFEVGKFFDDDIVSGGYFWLTINDSTEQTQAQAGSNAGA